MRNSLLFISLILLVVASRFSFADTVFLRNGNKFEGVVRKVENGYWIDGVLFDAGDVERIEKDADHKKDEPTYSILNSKISDKPIKTQIVLQILVKGNLSEEWIRETLINLFNSYKLKTDFKYHKFPTNIYIYAYESKEHYLTDQGQWIAMLAFGQADTSPRITINTGELALYDQEPETKFNLSEDKRKTIFKEIAQLENQSYREAEIKFPNPPSVYEEYSKHPDSYWKEQIRMKVKLQQEINNTYKQHLAQKYSLSVEHIQEILIEGMMKNWPSPVE